MATDNSAALHSQNIQMRIKATAQALGHEVHPHFNPYIMHTYFLQRGCLHQSSGGVARMVTAGHTCQRMLSTPAGAAAL
jgi:hypothetical protein